MRKRGKLKNGTRQYAKPASEVSVVQFPWDEGSDTLAAKSRGDVKALVNGLRDHVRSSKSKARKIMENAIDPETGEISEVEREETEAEILRRAATDYLRSSGANTRFVMEGRGEVDPDTGAVRNPNNVKGRRYLSVAEYYHAHGHIDARQLAAADALLKAWEKKDRRPAAINGDRVDSSPKPDDRTAIIVDHAMAYVRLSRLIPVKYAPFVYHVARDDKHLNSMPGYRKGGRYMEWLKLGLDGFANRIERDRR